MKNLSVTINKVSTMSEEFASSFGRGIFALDLKFSSMSGSSCTMYLREEEMLLLMAKLRAKSSRECAGKSFENKWDVGSPIQAVARFIGVPFLRIVDVQPLTRSVTEQFIVKVSFLAVGEKPTLFNKLRGFLFGYRDEGRTTIPADIAKELLFAICNTRDLRFMSNIMGITLLVPDDINPSSPTGAFWALLADL